MRNSCQALPDLRVKKKKKKGRREGAMKDLGRWKVTNDLALITAVGQTKDLDSVIEGVKFSCHFSLAEVQERWYALMYDPSAGHGGGEEPSTRSGAQSYKSNSLL
jgi:hypothetical protein